MVAHPRCPCTGASLDALSEVILKGPAPLRGYIVFLRPEGLPSSWAHTPLWEQARTIPGMIPVEDPEGRDAGLFGATTSGHVFLYDAQGTLQFSGGITSSRGAHGSSAGQDSILSLMAQKPCGFSRTPVFGCSLQENQDR
jgi:hypothetical protein